MFFTVASKLLINVQPRDREFLTVFIAGSVMYVALHWYLHLDLKSDMIESFKKYLYYVMMIDLATAYVYCTYFVPPPKELDDNDVITKTKREYTDEEKKIIMAKMQEARRQQMKKAQMHQQNSNNAVMTNMNDDQINNANKSKPIETAGDDNTHTKYQIDPRTGIPIGMDPRILLTMDPDNPPHGIDPRIIRHVQSIKAKADKATSDKANKNNEADEEYVEDIDDVDEEDKRKNDKGIVRSVTDKTTTITGEDKIQEKRSIFSRSEESKSDTDDGTESLKKIKTKKVASDNAKSDKDKTDKSDKKTSKTSKENASALDDTEIPMFT